MVAALRPLSPKLATAGEPTVVYGPPEVVERCTVYEVALATAVHDRLIADADTDTAATPLGAAGIVRPGTCAESAEVPDELPACTT